MYMGDYKNASNIALWMRKVRQRLPVEGGGNGRYHRKIRLMQKDQRQSTTVIGELTSSGYMLRGWVTKYREDVTRYRDDNGSLKSIIEGSEDGSSRNLGDPPLREGLTIRRRGWPDSTREGGNRETGDIERNKRTGETRCRIVGK